MGSAFSLAGGALKLELVVDLLQILVGGRAAEEELVLAVDRDHVLGGLAPPGEDLVVQRNADRGGRAGHQRDAAEGTQGLVGARRVVRFADIELDHLGAVALAGVLDGELQHAVVHMARAEMEVGVAQAIAEREERLAAEVAVGVALHIVILHLRQLGDGLVERHRQLAGRVEVAVKRLHDGRAALLARIPGLQDGVAALGLGDLPEGNDERFACAL